MVSFHVLLSACTYFIIDRSLAWSVSIYLLHSDSAHALVYYALVYYLISLASMHDSCMVTLDLYMRATTCEGCWDQGRS